MLILNHRQLLRDVIHRYFAASAAFYRHFGGVTQLYFASSMLQHNSATGSIPVHHMLVMHYN